MLSASPIKTDLIIGMTLAELFLLILLVVWYSQGTGAGPNWREIAEQRQREIDSLNQKLDAQKKEIEKWRAVSEFWRTRLGVDPPASVQQLAAALGTTQGKGIMEELKRGLPRCDENNVLAEVTVLNGTTEVHVYAPVKKMQEWPGSAAARVPSAGDLVKDGGEIQRFLNSVVSFYDYEKQKSSPCRFDYKLMYATDHDYREGRQRFESYFYPAGMIAADNPR